MLAPGLACLSLEESPVLVSGCCLLKASVAVEKSMLQQGHLEAPVAVHELMLEHLKACGRG